MASLLEEIARRKEKREPYIRIIAGMPIEETYHFEVAKKDAAKLFKECFALEYAQCKGEKKTIIEKMTCFEAPTSCFYIRTDSSSINTFNQILSGFIWPAAREQSYDEDALRLCLEESYVNAITHGNQGGCESLYTVRDLPVPANLAENKKKPVEVEFIINENCYALRVTDTGKGFDNSKIQLGKDGNLMAPSGRGLFLIQCYSDCMVFTKQDDPQKFSISMVKFK